MNKVLVTGILTVLFAVGPEASGQDAKQRVIVTTDGEADDRASMV
jgi:hypothetical protein